MFRCMNGHPLLPLQKTNELIGHWNGTGNLSPEIKHQTATQIRYRGIEITPREKPSYK